MKKRKYIIYSISIIFAFLFGYLCKTYFAEKMVSEISVIIEEVELKIPILWTIKGNGMYDKKEKPVVLLKIYSFDEELLKETFLYESTEACFRHYYPNGAGFDKDGLVKKEIGDFTVYEIHCTKLDKYSEKEEGFVDSEDEMYLDFIIAPSGEQIYCFYFMNDMSDSKKIEEFFSKASWSEQNISRDGQYRWES